jgi:hypothetical protein
MPGTINTTATISKNQRAVIDKYGFEVSSEKGVWLVKDELMFKKNALKDASKKGRYTGKTLDEALKQAVEVRNEHDGVKPVEVVEPLETSMTTPATEPTGKKAGGKTKKEKAPKVAKPKAERKENRYLRAAKIICDNLTITDEQLAKQADMSTSTAGHCLDAWTEITKVLLEKKWLKLPAAAKNVPAK